jgi:hypothetical protein
MEHKFIKPMLITTLVFAFISFGNIIRQKGIEDIKAVYIVSLLTCGIGVGAFLISLIVFVRSKKNK